MLVDACFVPLVTQLLSPFECTAFQTTGTAGVSKPSMMVIAESVQCGASQHVFFCVIAMATLFLYLPVATVLESFIKTDSNGRSIPESNDMRFSVAVISGEKLAAFLMVVCKVGAGGANTPHSKRPAARSSWNFRLRFALCDEAMSSADHVSRRLPNALEQRTMLVLLCRTGLPQGVRRAPHLQKEA